MVNIGDEKSKFVKSPLNEKSPNHFIFYRRNSVKFLLLLTRITMNMSSIFIALISTKLLAKELKVKR